MRCSRLEAARLRYVDGLCDAEERRAVEAHLGECAACAAEVERARAAAELLKRETARMPSEARWKRMEARVLEEAHAAPTRGRWRWWAAGALAAAAAALVLLALRPQRPPAPTVAAADLPVRMVAAWGTVTPLAPELDKPRVVAGGDGYALLDLGDARVAVGADTTLAVERAAAGERRLRVVRGSVSFEVAHLDAAARFRVVTDQGAIEVRGTRFAVAADGERTRVLLFEGSLDVQPAGAAHPVRLAAGNALELAGGSAVAVPLAAGAAPEFAARPAGGHASLLLRSATPGARVTVDGLPPRPSSLLVAVAPGRHAVAVAAPGYLTREVALDVPAEALVDRQIDLDREAAKAPPPAPPTVRTRPREPAPALDRDGLLKAARRLLAEDRPREVLVDVAPLVERRGPGWSEALYLAAQARERLDLLDAAAGDYRRCAGEGDGRWPESALYALARLEVRRGRPQPALAALQEMGRRFPDGPLAEDAQLERAQVLERLGRDRDAAAALDAYLAAWPRGYRAAEAAKRLGDLYRLRLGDCAKAERAYDRALAAGKGADADDALFYRGACEQQRGDPRAAATFDEYRRRFPSGRHRR